MVEAKNSYLNLAECCSQRPWRFLATWRLGVWYCVSIVVPAFLRLRTISYHSQTPKRHLRYLCTGAVTQGKESIWRKQNRPSQAKQSSSFTTWSGLIRPQVSQRTCGGDCPPIPNRFRQNISTMSWVHSSLTLSACCPSTTSRVLRTRSLSVTP